MLQERKCKSSIAVVIIAQQERKCKMEYIAYEEAPEEVREYTEKRHFVEGPIKLEACVKQGNKYTLMYGANTLGIKRFLISWLSSIDGSRMYKYFIVSQHELRTALQMMEDREESKGDMNHA